MTRWVAIATAAVFVAALLAAGLSSDEQDHDARATRPGIDGDAALDAALAPGVAAPAGGAPVDPAVRTEVDPSGAATTALPGAPRPAPAGALPSAGNAKGITDDEIVIGIGWTDLSALAAATAVVGGADTDAAGPSRDSAHAVVEHLNERGGIAGREIVPIYHEYPATAVFQGQSKRQAEQEMCATFTEDNEVFAMIPLASSEGIVAECAKTSDTPMISTSNLEWAIDERLFDELGRSWYRPNWMAVERRERTMIERLLAQGFFGDDIGAAKVGIIVEDKPQYRRGVDGTLRPGLVAAGLDVVSEIAFPELVDSPWNNYVLEMQSKGVTHVVWAQCGCGGTSATLFMRAAENQRWRPMWALGTDIAFSNVMALGPPEPQLQNVSGIGWNPMYDHAALQLGEPPLTPADAECRAILDASGKPVTSSNLTIFSSYCEGLFFLRFMLERAASLTTTDLAAAVEASGASYVPVSTPGVQFGPRRHDGPALVHDVAYDPECSCFSYTGGPHPTS